MTEILTLEQLKRMNDKMVTVVCKAGCINALVSYLDDEEDGDSVWLTNNLGTRITYEDAVAEGAYIFDPYSKYE